MFGKRPAFLFLAADSGALLRARLCGGARGCPSGADEPRPQVLGAGRPALPGFGKSAGVDQTARQGSAQLRLLEIRPEAKVIPGEQLSGVRAASSARHAGVPYVFAAGVPQTARQTAPSRFRPSPARRPEFPGTYRRARPGPRPGGPRFDTRREGLRIAGRRGPAP